MMPFIVKYHHVVKLLVKGFVLHALFWVCVRHVFSSSVWGTYNEYKAPTYNGSICKYYFVKKLWYANDMRYESAEYKSVFVWRVREI